MAHHSNLVMDHMTLLMFGWGCASAGFAARWIATHVVHRITERQELQAACDHVWLATTYVGAHPCRSCKWCKKQQHYHGDAETGEWRNL